MLVTCRIIMHPRCLRAAMPLPLAISHTKTIVQFHAILIKNHSRIRFSISGNSVCILTSTFYQNIFYLWFFRRPHKGDVCFDKVFNKCFKKNGRFRGKFSSLKIKLYPSVTCSVCNIIFVSADTQEVKGYPVQDPVRKFEG